MGLVEFDKIGRSDSDLTVRGDKIIFTKNWPAEAIKAMRKIGMRDDEWSNLYKILAFMYQNLEEGSVLVQIANDRKFAIEGRRIEASRGHFLALIELLELRAGLFAQVGHRDVYRQLLELLIILRNESKDY